jgi:hypothetical protein
MTTDNFRKPPLWFRSLNSAWKSCYPLGTKIKIEKDELIRASRKITGLKDLGSDFWDEPLDRLLVSINEESNLLPIGRFITRQRFINLLNIRLRAQYYFKRYPGILEQEIYPAWIIVGLQRTGTTKLHRLLATDPDHRVIPSWEVINPAPLDLRYIEKLQSQQSASSIQHPASSIQYPLPSDKRINVAKTSVAALKVISPGFFTIHPIDILQPEEDILLLDISFLSTTPEAMMNVPSYAAWLETVDQSPAYAYMVRLLKLMQWMKPAKRWVLKTPHHLEFPDLVEKNFGEVHFLWPHRSIYESVPSFLSMVTYNRMIFSNDADTQSIARHWVRKTGYMLQKAIDYRAKDGNNAKFIDILYNDLIKDSVGELTKIYKMNGGLTPDHIRRFLDHEKEHPHRKHGVHHYSLADFGLTEADIDRHTKHYQDFLLNII